MGNVWLVMQCAASPLSLLGLASQGASVSTCKMVSSFKAECAVACFLHIPQGY